MFAAQEILDFAVKIEKNGEAFYRDSLKRDLGAEIRSLFEALAEDEAKHRECFIGMRDGPETLNENAKSPEEAAIFDEILGDQTFSLGETDLSGIRNRADLIELAIEFEKDTILFYQMIRTFLTDAGAKGKVEAILEEEERHVGKLEDALKSTLEQPS